MTETPTDCEAAVDIERTKWMRWLNAWPGYDDLPELAQWLREGHHLADPEYKHHRADADVPQPPFDTPS